MASLTMPAAAASSSAAVNKPPRFCCGFGEPSSINKYHAQPKASGLATPGTCVTVISTAMRGISSNEVT